MPDPVGAGAGAQGYDTGTPGVVVDRVTGLMWQRQVPAGTYSWTDAKASCACLALAGHDDWRLPTRLELVSLVDFTRRDPAIDVTAFPDTPPEWFWTGSPRAADPTLAPGAWFVYFENGYSNHHELDASYRVRCLRDPGGRPPPVGERYRAEGGTVRDQRTGLTWQQAVDPGLRTWTDAQAYCRALPLAGGGWRLPSMKQLQTLVDETEASPAIDATAFPATPLDPFWTATPLAAAAGSAWRVSFVLGYTYDATTDHEYYTRCVR